METPTDTKPEIDTCVGCVWLFWGNGVQPFIPIGQMDKARAIRLAAWLVALCDDSEEHSEFRKVLTAIEST